MLRINTAIALMVLGITLSAPAALAQDDPAACSVQKCVNRDNGREICYEVLPVAADSWRNCYVSAVDTSVSASVFSSFYRWTFQTAERSLRGMVNAISPLRTQKTGDARGTLDAIQP